MHVCAQVNLVNRYLSGENKRENTRQEDKRQNWEREKIFKSIVKSTCENEVNKLLCI